MVKEHTYTKIVEINTQPERVKNKILNKMN
jgi:hypothetical protein